MLATALLIVGGLAATWTLWVHVLRPSHDLLRRYQKGSVRPWALITGASDGIGKAFALELAKRGFNIVLVSRTQSKLDACAQEIKKASPSAETHVVSIDFAKSDFHAIRKTVDDACKNRDIALLINNAGMGTLPTRLHELNDSETQQAIDTMQVNVVAFTAVLRGVTPHLVARDHRGGIVNVSSASALHGLPYNAVYAGSKAYNNLVSHTIGVELKENKIDVLSFTPLFIQTNMVRAKANLFIATAPAAVNACLRSLGYESRTTGTLSHKLQSLAATIYPPLAGEMSISTMKKVRKQALARMAAKAKKQ
ncbi:hypothetical protein PTSG_04111 [Salpingoeca rosetta]|uniref:Uncharacterized protein n=1 Tax=Salpingoeca rosetta (strain ATCC 50818 / BSB-021) TaxID=946362 RepID=F2U6M1_SALR5|nr:uncharacterized protein PTSG_04111 [Salpingoeca rosetta]EGD83503.1 hypothetical protein PTSG_04111 [Salpingoeca rosetta]|eukprot:XP_004995007.1 hypothetical protein PTSG_04111 [Salpingoeca rosetta]